VPGDKEFIKLLSFSLVLYSSLAQTLDEETSSNGGWGASAQAPS
jgi:hypothetical protein